jgi:hypothetical protein
VPATVTPVAVVEGHDAVSGGGDRPGADVTGRPDGQLR